MRSDHTVGRELVSHPVDVSVPPALDNRNRLTCAFRIVLAIPHLILVGAPVALAMSFLFWPIPDSEMEFGGGGVLGLGVVMIAVISWFAIVFTGRMPRGLWDLSAYYLRWRVRAIAWMALLRDEFPPFGDDQYPVALELPRYEQARDRLSVAFRAILVLPHLIMVWVLGVAWFLATVWAWLMIVFTGKYPVDVYPFAVGVLRWSTSVEAYVLLLHDEYPPFSLT
ncbi:MAG TPA: DUF4389 domain-containing protein [Gemmatimonadaceae bacterium]